MVLHLLMYANNLLWQELPLQIQKHRAITHKKDFRGTVSLSRVFTSSREQDVLYVLLIN